LNEREGATDLVNVVLPQGPDGAHLPNPTFCKTQDWGNHSKIEIHKGQLGIVREKFLLLEAAWINLIRSEKTVQFQWRKNASFVSGKQIIFF
jgi:hypothetical protein